MRHITSFVQHQGHLLIDTFRSNFVIKNGIRSQIVFWFKMNFDPKCQDFTLTPCTIQYLIVTKFILKLEMFKIELSYWTNVAKIP